MTVLETENEDYSMGFIEDDACNTGFKDFRISFQIKRYMSRNQFNQKLKLMVEAPEYVIYSNTPPHTRAH